MGRQLQQFGQDPEPNLGVHLQDIYGYVAIIIILCIFLVQRGKGSLPLERNKNHAERRDKT